MTKFKNIITLSIKNILNSKLRSLLTILGLVIGIASVIVLVGIGNGTSNQVSNQVKSLGADVLTLDIKSSDDSLEYTDVKNITQIENIEAIVPYKSINNTVTRENVTSKRANIVATIPEYIDVMGLTISDGRLMSEIDLENYTKVCLLGSDLSKNLFGLSNPVGQSIKIDGDNYIVIGILTSQGTTMGNNIDDSILIPFTTSKYLGNDTTIKNLYIKVDNEESIDDTISNIESYITNYYGISSDYFSISSQGSMLNTIEDIDNSFSLLLVGIASISLIVGGIGVMNVMLVSVTERTKEIGIRKALGAKKSDIMLQFLVESLVLCIFGGIIGLLFGIGIGFVLNNIGYSFNPSNNIIVISFLSSAIVGIIFGLFPASKAANLSPIEALRDN